MRSVDVRPRYGKTRFVVAMGLLMIMMGMTIPAIGQDAPAGPTASVSVDFLSQYIYRGMAMSRDSAVIQPSGTVSWKGFSLNAWGNLDTAQQFKDGRASWNETDLTLLYTRELVKNLNWTAGVTYYILEDVQDSVEVFSGLAYTFPWVTVGLLAYREVAHYPGWWVQLDLSRNFPLPWRGMNVDLGASFGYLLSEDAGTSPINAPGEYSGLMAGQLSAGLNVPFGRFVFTPKIGLAFPLSGDASDRIRGLSVDSEDTHVFGGIKLMASF